MSGRLGLEYKDSVEPVTEADRRSDALICDAIVTTFRHHQVLSEEGVTTVDLAGPVWVVDPVDGTANYARSHPYVAVSIAYAIDGMVQVGVVHAPFLGETYAAARGCGADLNGTPIRPSNPPDLRHSVISTGFPHRKTDLEPLVERVRRLLTHWQDPPQPTHRPRRRRLPHRRTHHPQRSDTAAQLSPAPSHTMPVPSNPRSSTPPQTRGFPVKNRQFG